MIRTGQLGLISMGPSRIPQKYILGARNIPSSQLKTSLAALRKIKLSFSTKNQRAQRVYKCCPLLEKQQGFTEIYILSMVWILGKGK